MKTRYFVSFNEGKKSYRRVRRLLETIGCSDGLPDDENDILAGFFAKTLDSTDPKLAALRSLLKRKGIKWSEREEHVYGDDELRSFPLLELSIDRKPLNVGGADYGTTYDLSNACPRCGSGAVQTSPLLLPLSGYPKKGDLCATVFHEILVSVKLAQALREDKVTGLELRQIRFYRNNEPLPWWQMISTFEMPKMSKETRGITWHDGQQGDCTVCGRDGYSHSLDEPWQIAYSKAQVDPAVLPDAVRTWEVFGNAEINYEEPRRSRFGEQRILVKPKVFDVFRRLTVRHARFVPVRIVN